MPMSAHLLVVDDHSEIREQLSRYLRQNGFRVTVADGGEQMARVLQDANVDLMVLDVMMPGEDGLSICRRLATQKNIPIILLTALADDTDQIIGLEMGADDYITKPFNPRELLARIRAVLRRAQALPTQRETPGEETLHFSGWTLNLGSRELKDKEGIQVPLSNAEFLLLSVLAQRAGRVLSRDQLLDLTQGREAAAYDRAIDNQVMRLRKKIEQDPSQPKLLKTVRGGGYILVKQLDTNND